MKLQLLGWFSRLSEMQGSPAARPGGFTQHLARGRATKSGLNSRRRRVIPELGVGFTIAELLIAIVAGSVLVGGIQVASSNYVHLNQKGRNLAMTNSYIEARVESLRNVGYLSLANGTTDLSGELPAGLPSPKSGSMTVTDQGSGIKQVAMSVTYNDKGTDRTYSYTTLIGELGVGN